MRLWTVQPEEVYDLINSTGVYRCDANKSELISEFGFGKAYSWIACQMTKRIGPPPEGVTFPVWAWHTMNWKHKRPDMRWSEFRYEKKPFVLMEVEKDDADVLLSDEELWHFVLNNVYLGRANNKEEDEEEQREYNSLAEPLKIEVKEKSWEKIFKVSPTIDNGWWRVGCFVQATFWELRKEDVVKVWTYR